MSLFVQDLDILDRESFKHQWALKDQQRALQRDNLKNKLKSAVKSKQLYDVVVGKSKIDVAPAQKWVLLSNTTLKPQNPLSNMHSAFRASLIRNRTEALLHKDLESNTDSPKQTPPSIFSAVERKSLKDQ